MLDNLIQEFAGNGGNALEGSQLSGGVGQMLGSAPSEHSVGAIGEAMQALGGGGFGQSVTQGATNASPQQRSGLAGMLMGAISQGGGSPPGVLSHLGIGGQNPSPQELGTLAQYVGDNHPSAFAGLLGNQMSGSSGGGAGSEILHVLGNPMVRQVGISLAKRLM